MLKRRLPGISQKTPGAPPARWLPKASAAPRTTASRSARGGGWLCLLLCLTIGCQSNSGGGLAFPWQSQNPIASVPPPSANNPNNWNPPANPATASAWDPNASSGSNPIGQLAELMRRQNEQTRLSEEQRLALAQMTEFQRLQTEQLQAVAGQRQNEELQKLQRQAELVQQQQQELENLYELRRRALELDANNRDLHSQLAQAEQQNRLFEDQTRLLKQQLRDTADRLDKAIQEQSLAQRRLQETQSEAQRQYQIAQQEAQQQVQLARQSADQRIAALESTLQRRGGATIRANSSVQQKLAPVAIAGLQVRQDGDVIRIEMPSDQIFAPGTATLNPTAPALIEKIANAVRQQYPRQIVGIEAHTDNNAISSNAWRSNHQLSIAQAMAVFEQLTQQHQFGVQQLFVLGHGANYPVASNGTPAGQQRNRRVEVVIYPETVDRR